MRKIKVDKLYLKAAKASVGRMAKKAKDLSKSIPEPHGQRLINATLYDLGQGYKRFIFEEIQA